MVIIKKEKKKKEAETAENKACIKNRWVLLRDGIHWSSPKICMSVQNTAVNIALYDS